MIKNVFAASLLCVTTITHLFLSLANVFNILIISPAVTLSRLPVGSSASIIGASETNALAIATLCCCPPDNFITFLFICFLSKPSSNKILSSAGEIIDILKTLAKDKNKCVIVVTHSKEVADSADIILELSGKKLKKVNKMNLEVE